MAGTVEGMEVALNMGDAWNDLVSSGQVVDVLVTAKFTEEPDVWAGFLVTGVSLVALDSSLRLKVRSLGCPLAPVTKELSSFFNRKDGFIHLCPEYCAAFGDNDDFDVTRLRRFSPERFARPYMTAHTRKQLKKWLGE